MTSLVNAKTIDLICKLFSRDDYVSFAERLCDASDAKNLLDFILHLLREGRLTNMDGTVDFTQQGRRFMLKVITKTPVIPESLIITGISMPAERDRIGCGGFVRLFKGKQGGKTLL